MDPEPDRCRRTDGKKWRCGRIAVPYQKYCDRHMHRGRQGSRKHVERDNQNASEPDRRASTLNSSSDASEYGDGILCVSAQSNLGQSHLDRKRGGNHPVEEGKECSFQDVDPKKINHGTDDNVNPPRAISPGFSLSPKIVLYCGAGNVELSCLGPKGSKNITESNPQRCRRTDGKKWQCSRDALPSQKYCQSHMHRGARRVTLKSQYAITFPESSTRKGHPSSTLPRSLDDNINLNAIPKSPQHVGGNNSTSSTSDASHATTITDGNISFSLAQSLINC